MASPSSGLAIQRDSNQGVDSAKDIAQGVRIQVSAKQKILSKIRRVVMETHSSDLAHACRKNKRSSRASLHILFRMCFGLVLFINTK